MGTSSNLIVTDQLSHSLPELTGWHRFASRVGVPALLALVFGWALVQISSGDLKKIPMLEAQVQAQSLALKTHDEDTKLLLRSMLRRLGGICLNAAKTSEQQQRCLE